MGESKMKLLSLKVKELYGCYDYDVHFNSDVTFLYGMNGCGKTTILNITEAIITGQLFKLFNYNFKYIELKYEKIKFPKNIMKILISSNEAGINIEFENNTYTIQMDDLEDVINSNKSTLEISRYFYNRYEFLLEIKRTFNYVYLPLSRSYISLKEVNELYPFRFHHRLMDDEELNIGNENRDNAMIAIEILIQNHYSKLNSTLNTIADSFRDSILKSQIEIDNSFNVKDYLQKIQSTSVSSLKKTQSMYIKTLKELGIISRDEEKDYYKFFSDFIIEFTDFLESKDSKGIPLNLLLKFQEISKSQKTVDIAERMEQRKNEERKPLEIFLKTMNSFFANDEDGKEIYITNRGFVCFKTKYSDKKISIHHLSSGEKQLITFFANLIFNVHSNSSGIFVVDEPELSLHLSWQKIFIDKVLEIDKDIQLIFATHAPELVGRRRDKMYRLEKKYVEDNKQNG